MVHGLVVLFEFFTQPAALQERTAECLCIHALSVMHDDFLDRLVHGTANLREA